MKIVLNWFRNVVVRWLKLDELQSDVNALRYIVEIQRDEIDKLEEERLSNSDNIVETKQKQEMINKTVYHKHNKSELGKVLKEHPSSCLVEWTGDSIVSPHGTWEIKEDLIVFNKEQKKS